VAGTLTNSGELELLQPGDVVTLGKLVNFGHLSVAVGAILNDDLINEGGCVGVALGVLA
jgi:hypothetical protein